MTNEQAAKILDPDSSKDALAAISYYAGFGGEEAELAVIRDACRLAVIALRKDALQDENIPSSGENIMSKMRYCPFCGCKMKSDKDYPIYGDHKEGCYFKFIDNQNQYDFTNESDLNKLITAWNKRVNEVDL